MLQSIKNKIEKLKNEGTIFVIRPQKPVNVSRLEKDTKKLENLYKDGINDTRNLLNDLKSYLNS